MEVHEQIQESQGPGKKPVEGEKEPASIVSRKLNECIMIDCQLSIVVVEIRDPRQLDGSATLTADLAIRVPAPYRRRAR